MEQKSIYFGLGLIAIILVAFAGGNWYGQEQGNTRAENLIKEAADAKLAAQNATTQTERCLSLIYAYQDKVKSTLCVPVSKSNETFTTFVANCDSENATWIRVR